MTKRPKEYVLHCPECNSLMVLKLSDRFGWFYSCSRYPDCRNTHSCHQKEPLAGKPCGIPADKETRDWRTKTHAALDPLWKHTRMKRISVYRWLAKQLGMTEKDCHIARFDIETCKRAIPLCEKKYTTLEKVYVPNADGEGGML